jgi:probable phosphoglycerate mutase
MDKASFFFIRHGITNANRQNLLCGGGWDIELSDEGRAEAREAVEVLRPFGDQIKSVCFSPLRRAVETKDILLAALNKDVRQISVPDLAEWQLGDWEGKSSAEVIPSGADFFKSNPPNGETHGAFRSRVACALDFCLTQPSKVLIVAHGGVGGMILRYLNSDEGWMTNATLTRFDIREGRAQITRYPRPSQQAGASRPAWAMNGKE